MWWGLEHMARIILIIYFPWLSTWLMQNCVDLLNTKEYSHVLIVTTFKHDNLSKVYLNYVKKQMVIFRGIIMLVCQHSKSLTSQKNHIYYLWGDIEKSDTGVTPEARQWLSQPNKYYVIYFISEWLSLSLHNSSTSLGMSFLKLTFFLVVLMLTLFL